MSKKSTLEEVTAKFDAIWKKYGCTWEGLQEWRKEVVAMGWTDQEFDEALTQNRVQAGKKTKKAA